MVHAACFKYLQIKKFPVVAKLDSQGEDDELIQYVGCVVCFEYAVTQSVWLSFNILHLNLFC